MNAIEHQRTELVGDNVVEVVTPDEIFGRLQREGRRVHYFPNPGNAGDALIALATLQLFDKHRVDYVVESRLVTFDPTDKLVAYSGGGNLGPQNGPGWQFLKACCASAFKIVVLPHTICGDTGVLSELDSRATVYCREPVSFGFVRQRAKSSRVELAEDLALTLNARSVIDNLGKFSVLAALIKRAYLDITRDGARHSGMPKSVALTFLRDRFRGKSVGLRQGRLTCLRSDLEKTAINVPACNVDLPARIPFSSASPCNAGWAAGTLLKEIDCYDEVYTNRLHVAIGAALLGKNVLMGANNYYKNRAIYDFSLKKRFCNVVWDGSAT